MITIKQATKEDSKVIEQIYLQKVEELAFKGLKQWDKEEVLWNTLAKDYQIEQFYIVYKDKKAVGGFVLVDYDPTYWKDDEAKQFLYIHKVMVLDEVEKTGISNMILDFFKKETKARGYQLAKLDVREHKQKLRAYYERNGFVLHSIVDLGKGYLTALYTYS